MSSPNENTPNSRRFGRLSLTAIVGGLCIVGDGADVMFNLIDLATLALEVLGGTGSICS